ncbi:hypothetical protein KVT40_003427 [Elsinoe batatas]|uniref:Uncharacterized protein n=1 Tax=Elsinoe batatas TaxID=2601811 RepID=A0A8K0L5X7_9PEZI|nr:hypothetical protein KVT40_003427 [Elsinoe batatas]
MRTSLILCRFIAAGFCLDSLTKEATGYSKLVTRQAGSVADDLKDVLIDPSGRRVNNRAQVVTFRLPSNDSTSIEKDFTWSRTWLLGDNRGEARTVQNNQTLAAVAYLSFIVDNYETLPEVTAFVTPTRYFGLSSPLRHSAPSAKPQRLQCHRQRPRGSALRQRGG